MGRRFGILSALRLGVLAALTASLVLPAVASAQSEQDSDARRRFRIAQAHYDNGEFEEAAAGFEEAYRLSGRPQLLYNTYIAYRDAQNLAQAVSALRRYLEQVPDAPDRDQLSSRLERMQAALERQGGSVTPPVEPDAGDPPPVDPGPDPGDSGDTGTGTGVPDDTGTGDDGSVGGEVGVGAGPADEGGGGALPIPAIIVGGAGVALVIGGVITGLMASSAQSELEDGCPSRMGCDPSLEDTQSSGETLALVTDILLFGGLAAVGTGVALLFVMGGDEEPAQAGEPVASVGCGPGGCSGSVSMSF